MTNSTNPMLCASEAWEAACTFEGATCPGVSEQITLEQLGNFVIGDVFVGDARSMPDPQVFFRPEVAGFIGLNGENIFASRQGYCAFAYDLRSESHFEFREQPGFLGGGVIPTDRVGSLPDAMISGLAESPKGSAELLQWIINNGAALVAAGYNALKTNVNSCIRSNIVYENASEQIAEFEKLSKQLAVGELVVEVIGISPSLVTDISVTSEAAFRKYLEENPDDNIALSHPPTAEKYL